MLLPVRSVCELGVCPFDRGVYLGALNECVCVLCARGGVRVVVVCACCVCRGGEYKLDKLGIMWCPPGSYFPVGA